MKNYQQIGDVIEVPAAATAVAAGQLVVLGSILAVANHPAEVGGPYNAQRRGVFLLPKSAGALKLGQPLMWDASAGAFAAVGATAAGDVTGAAAAFEAAADAATTVAVLLPGAIGTVAA